MLHRVEAETAQLALVDDPLAPCNDVFLHLWMRKVDVGEHEEIGITRLVVDRLGPVLVVTDDAEDAGLVVASVVVRSAEVLPAILLLAVFAVAAREVEA